MNRRGSLLRQAGATLCVALVLIFNVAGASAAVNQIQHMPGAPESHQHLTFSDLVTDDHHDDHHADQGHREIVSDHHYVDAAAQVHDDHDTPGDTDSKKMAGDNHHHHHGDIGSSIVVLSANVSGPVPLWDRDNQVGADSVRISFRGSLPERPPRTILISV